MTDVTHILGRIEDGDPSAAEALLPLVYHELRQLAAAKLAREKPGQTLQPTALVHEAYLRLVDDETEQRWDSRGHFFSAAAEAMRRILIEQARAKGSLKKGEGFERVELSGVIVNEPISLNDLIAIDDTLTELEQHDPQAATLVKLRYFAGFSHQEAAAALGVSRRAADRLWALSRAWLFRKLSHEDSSENPLPAGNS